MTQMEVILAIVLSAVCTFGLRAFPFFVFRDEKQMPKWLEKLGQMLPSAIMAVLIVYCLKDVGTNVKEIEIPKIIATFSVAILYKWKHNTLVTIALGTIVYMVLLQLCG